MSKKILVVDDDLKLVDLLKLYLERDGYKVRTAYTGKDGLEKVAEDRPDLVVLDIMLPETDGLGVLRKIREESSLPVIMLTARTTEQDRITGLDLGADDYVIKPFSPKELLSRIRAVLRRVYEDEAYFGPQEIKYRDLAIKYLNRQVLLNDKPVELTATEYKILAFMAREPGRVFSRLQIIDRVFGLDFDGFERSIDVHIANLRKKIEPDLQNPVYIKTVYGTGYKFGE